MNKENVIKSIMLAGFLILFLSGSRFHAEDNKIICSEGKCSKPHNHGELNFHERFRVSSSDNFGTAVVKSSANFWEANATGMTFALIIGGAALSLALSYKGFGRLLEIKGIKGAALGSVLGIPLNMCANCSAVTSIGMTERFGSTEATLGIILGGALFNVIGIVAMFGLFNPAVALSRIVFSLVMILAVVPLVSRVLVNKNITRAPNNPVFDKIACYFPEKSIPQSLVKSGEDWIIATGNIAFKLVPLMLIGTLFIAIVRVLFPNEALQSIVSYNPLLIIVIVSFIGTLLSIPVLFEILLGTILLSLGFSNGVIAAMVFTAPSFGIFTLVLTRQRFGGFKIPFIMLGITFILGIGAGLLADFLTQYFQS